MPELILDSEALAEADTERTLAELGVTRDQVLAEIAYRQRKKHEMAVKRMAAAQRAGGERRMLREGRAAAGAVEMMIDPVSYHYWGQRLGYECWEDAQFRREYLRDNPSSRVRTLTRIMFTPSLAVQARLKAQATARLQAAAAPVPSIRPRVTGKHGRWAA